MHVSPLALAALKSQVVDHRHAKSVHLSTSAIFAMGKLALKKRIKMPKITIKKKLILA